MAYTHGSQTVRCDALVRVILIFRGHHTKLSAVLFIELIRAKFCEML